MSLIVTPVQFGHWANKTEHQSLISMWKKVWNDPVWSKVIAGAILGLAGIVWVLIAHPDASALLNWMKAETIPNWAWVTGCPLFFVAVYLWFRRQHRKTVIDSNEWFKLIEQNLVECNAAHIYLRTFDHPDDFREEHREQLLKIIRTIKDRLAAGANIKIISYSPKAALTGVDWLVSQLGNREVVGSSIQIRTTQPMSNSSSMYLFDNRLVIYNKRTDGTVSYHIDNQSNSILFEFLRSGFEKLWSSI